MMKNDSNVNSEGRGKSLEKMQYTLKYNVSYVSYFATHCTTHKSTKRGGRCDTCLPLNLRHILNTWFESILRYVFYFFLN
jgi:hypothetical protein